MEYKLELKTMYAGPEVPTGLPSTRHLIMTWANK